MIERNLLAYFPFFMKIKLDKSHDAETGLGSRRKNF